MKRPLRYSIAIALLSGVACGKKAPVVDPETGPAADRRREILRGIAENAVTPTNDEVVAQFAALDVATKKWAASGSPEDREAARDAWRAAFATWQRAEVMQFGPAGAMGAVSGGEDIRDAVYSWPTTSACRIDQEIVEQGYADAESFAAEAVNVRGLDAIEYLLFHEGESNDCDPARSINADGSWDALGIDEIEARRAEYAAAASTAVAADADRLAALWRDGFVEELATAGAGSATYPSSQEAFNEISDALFYVESEVKDMKLAEPVGLLNCLEATCPDARELRWSDDSLLAVAENLRGFETVYLGGSPTALGFDDLLIDRGAGDLNDDLLAKLATARSTADDLAEATFVDVLASDRDRLVALHTDIKALTDLLKTQFVGVLDLELPDRAEGDND